MWLQRIPGLIICILHSIQIESSAIPVSRHNNSQAADIMFPSDSTNQETIILLPPDTISKCSKKSTFCEDVEQYPTATLSKILKSSAAYNLDYFKQVPAADEGVDTRFDSDAEQYICPSYVKTIFPKVAENVHHQWKFIYNLDGFRQGVRVEICRRETSCNLFDEPPMGITTQCKQKYIERRLLSADENGKPVVDYFKLPSSCACAYRRQINFYGFNKRYK